MAFKHKQLPPSLNFTRANSHIDLASSPFYVNTALQPWQPPMGATRCAAVSAFGFSGTNAHLVVEEYENVAIDSPQTSTEELILLSAQRKDRLAVMAKNLCDYLVNLSPETRPPLHDIAYTLQTSRRVMDEKVAFVAADIEDLLEKLKTLSGEGQSVETAIFKFSDDKTASNLSSLFEGQTGKDLLINCFNNAF